ncbi:LOW QUALITY PROTEIN: hypothetical protein MAR_030454, partial [Mya arenaria]
MTLAHIYVCRWTHSSALHEHIRAIDADITCICETHLNNQNIIEINDYNWYGFNRAEIHIYTPKASGGVGVLVKSKLCDIYDVQIVDRSFDCIITGADFVVFACYCHQKIHLDVEMLNHFMSIYLHKYIVLCDGMFYFHARFGILSDVLNDCDSIPALDSHKLHGLIGDITAQGTLCYKRDDPSMDRYYLKKIPANFTTSDLSRWAIINLKMTIETKRENQTSIDTIC